jgi:hypothetical protein
MSIKINNEDIRLRPSAVESFYGCAYQWGKAFLEGSTSIPNSRAAIGTAIHAGVEAMWTDAITSGKKDPNLSMMTDAAMEAWKEEAQKGMQFGDGENDGSCHVEIIKGTQAFVEDIVPFTAIPDAVETFFSIPIHNPIVAELGGTLDYLSKHTIADVKTSKRKSGPEGHTVQQSIYKYLAEANGHKINTNLIQQVVLKKQPEGAILKLEADIDLAKYLVNGILDTMDLIAKDVAPIEVILRPNPKHMFCSEKFCAHYNTCPAIKGNLAPAKQQQKVKL